MSHSTSSDASQSPITSTSSPFYLEVSRVFAARRWLEQLEASLREHKQLVQHCNKGHKVARETTEEQKLRLILNQEVSSSTMSDEIEDLLSELENRLEAALTATDPFEDEIESIELTEGDYISDPDPVRWPFPIVRGEISGISTMSLSWVKANLLLLHQHMITSLELRQTRLNNISELRFSEESITVQQAQLARWDEISQLESMVTLQYCYLLISLSQSIDKTHLEIEKVQSWLTESVIDLVLEWKRNTMEK